MGHPLADVAYLCMPYEIPPFVAGPLSGFRGLNLDKHGVPPLEDLVDGAPRNCGTRRAGRPSRRSAKRACPTSTWPRAWATSASSICRGVYSRAKMGTGVVGGRGRRRRARRHALDVSVRAGDHAAVCAGRGRRSGKDLWGAFLSPSGAFRGDGAEGVPCS